MSIIRQKLRALDNAIIEGGKTPSQLHGYIVDIFDHLDSHEGDLTRQNEVLRSELSDVSSKNEALKTELKNALESLEKAAAPQKQKQSEEEELQIRILQFLKLSSADREITAGMVANACGISRDVASLHLQRLKKVGFAHDSQYINRESTWWRTNQGNERLHALGKL